MRYDRRMDEPKKQRGRPRKPAEEKLHRHTVFLTDRQRDKVDAYGFDWLRKLIERARPPKP